MYTILIFYLIINIGDAVQNFWYGKYNHVS